MIGNPFTYPAWDLTTMVQLDTLPYGGVSFGEVINQPGPWSGQINLSDPRVQGLAWWDASRPSRTLLCVDLAGVLVWGGILWTRMYDDSDKALKIGAQEVGSYFQQRIQAADYTATWSAGADPMTIARTVVQDAQSTSGGSIGGGITLVLNPAVGSGQSVVASFPGTQLGTVQSIVDQLAGMGYTFGFDYSFDVAYIAGTRTPAVTMNIWYPRKGRSAADSNIVIEHRDTIGFTYPEDGTRQANSIFESGGTGTEPIELTTVTPGYPLLESSISRGDVVSEQVLSNSAFNDAGALVWPVVTPTITVAVPLPDATGRIDPSRLSFGQFSLGDSLFHRIDPVAVNNGVNACPRFPSGARFEWRMSQWTCTVPDEGVPSILFDLTSPPSSTLPPTQPPLI